MRLRLVFILLTAVLVASVGEPAFAKTHHSLPAVRSAQTRHAVHAHARKSVSSRSHRSATATRGVGEIGRADRRLRSSHPATLVSAAGHRRTHSSPARRKGKKSSTPISDDVEWAGVRKPVAAASGSPISEPSDQRAELTHAASAESVSGPLHRIHDPKVHHGAEESDQASGSPEFVKSVERQAATSPAAAPVLAAGTADEMSTLPQKAEPISVTGLNNQSLKGRPQGRTAYLSSRTMPAGPAMEQTDAAPHVPSVEEQVLTPTMLPALYNRRGHLVMPPAMKGTHEILVHQNTMADSEGLTRIRDDADLVRMRSNRLLVSLPESGALHVDERLPDNRRYCRPWTGVFLANLARAHYARFHTPLQVNSAVRTVAFQERLIRTNGNAAPAEGLTASPHLTGQAVDLAKHGLSLTEIAWLRGYLMPLVQDQKIDVEEEFQQACFHISVYKSYLPEPSPRRLIAEKKHHPASVLASAIR